MKNVLNVIPVDEVKDHKTKVEILMDQMSAIKVTSKEELTAVAGHIGMVKKALKVVTEARDKYIAPAKEIIDRAKADFDPIILKCKEIEKVLKDKAEVFMLADEKREEGEKKKEVDKVESGYQKPETAVKNIESIKVAEKKVTTENGTLGMSKVPTAVIEDESLIPEDYWIPRTLDMAKINKVTKAGVAIPGVRIEMKAQMNMRTR